MFFLIVAGTLLGPVVGAVLVLAWAHRAHIPLAALGLQASRNWTATVFGGAAFGIALKLLLKAVAMPLLGAPATNAAYHYLAGNTAALPGIIATVLISAGIAEEIVYRGYLFERMRTWLGPGDGRVTAAILVSSVLFAAAHYVDQGFPGVEQALMTGVVFAGLYAWRKELWIVMVAHAAFDLTAVVLIYKGWEAPVAHFWLR